jgi:hypothetical protein
MTSKLPPRAVVSIAAALAFLAVPSNGFPAHKSGKASTRIHGAQWPIYGPQAQGPAPFFDAVQEPSLPAAEAALGWTVRRPNLCVANDNNIGAIYVNTGTSELFVRYDDAASSGCPGFADGHVELLEQADTPTSPELSRPSQQDVRAPEPAAIAEMKDQAVAEGPIATFAMVDDAPSVLMQGNYPGDCSAPLPSEDGCAPAQANDAAIDMMMPTGTAFRSTERRTGHKRRSSPSRVPSAKCSSESSPTTGA